MNNWLKNIVIKAYILSGGLIWGRYLLASHSLIILYHDVHAVKLEEHFNFWVKYYQPIGLQKLDDYFNGKSPFPDKSIIVTIDDGWKNNFSLVELCREKDLPLTIFILSGLVGTNRRIWNYPLREVRPDLNNKMKSIKNKHRLEWLNQNIDFEPEKEFATRSMLSLEELRVMRQNINFQSHGSFHPVFNMCDEKELLDDMMPAKKNIEAITCTECYAIAYPYGKGRVGKREATIAKKAGYRIGRVANDPRMVTAKDDKMLLPSLNIPDNCDLETLKTLLAWCQIKSLVKRFL